MPRHSNNILHLISGALLCSSQKRQVGSDLNGFRELKSDSNTYLKTEIFLGISRRLRVRAAVKRGDEIPRGLEFLKLNPSFAPRIHGRGRGQMG